MRVHILGAFIAHFRLISTQEKFPRTENFPKISLLKVENFQLQNFFPTESLCRSITFYKIFFPRKILKFEKWKWSFITRNRSKNCMCKRVSTLEGRRHFCGLAFCRFVYFHKWILNLRIYTSMKGE
jgi:hypothetical protein